MILQPKKLQSVLHDLTHSGLRLYMYMAVFGDGCRIVLSPTAVEKFSGLKKTSFYRAYNELLTKRYITEDEGGCVMFHSYPLGEFDWSKFGI